MRTARRYKELRPGQLRAFCACAEHKSFSAAARALQVSQPVVWQQVRALERDFGSRFLQRRGRGLELTEVGRTFFELAGSLVAGMDSLEQAFQDLRDGLPSPLVVAGNVTVFTQELAPVVARFCRQHPKVRLSVLTQRNAMIEQLVAAGQADVGVMPHSPVTPRNPLLVSEILSLHPWRLILPKDHPLAAKRRVRAADLIRWPLILPGTDNDWRREVDLMLHREGILHQLQLALEIDNSLAASRLVSLGLGLTVTPYGTLDFPNLCMRPLGHLFRAERLIAVWRRGATARPQARLFIDFARRCLTAEVPPRRL
jgi:DNA-binding transcriptional LysR family regulator